MSFLITDALAAAAPAAAPTSTQGLLSLLPMLLILVFFMYFMIIRPQSKRAKEHKTLVSSLQKGDEVMTAGGILGKIEKIGDDFIVLNIAEGININVQKHSISTVVPRGTIKSV
jgi:preprotein translocase subunit YajC